MILRDSNGVSEKYYNFLLIPKIPRLETTYIIMVTNGTWNFDQEWSWPNDLTMAAPGFHIPINKFHLIQRFLQKLEHLTGLE